ncbi:MAG: hypothetical protein MJ203_00755 [archaeon]|nr:hypothetical protein [archaeon]
MVSKTFKIFLCTLLLISLVGFSMSLVSAADIDSHDVIDSVAMEPVSVDSTVSVSDSSFCSQNNDFSLNDSSSLSSSDASVSNLKESVLSDTEIVDKNKSPSTNVKKLVDDKNKPKKLLQQENVDSEDSVKNNPNVVAAVASASFAKDTAGSTIAITNSAKKSVYSTMDNIYSIINDVRPSINSYMNSEYMNNILPYYSNSLKISLF